MTTLTTEQHEPTSLPQTLRKRDGSEEPFDARKIASAIQRAGEATGEFNAAEANHLAIRAMTLLTAIHNNAEPINVEDVQDIVEEVLLNSSYRKTAKAYIIYRDQHARIRDMVNRAGLDLIDGYLEKMDWRVKENSNMGYSLQGLNNHVSSEISKIYWLNKIYSPEIREAHMSGAVHIHDLGLLSVYCVGWNLQDLLTVGFTGAPGKAESAPAKHLRSALGQIVNFFYTLQGEAAGAQAFSNFDTLLAPFIRYDHLTKDEVKQAFQEFVFNMNVATRVGFQTPFTNITMDLNPPASLAKQPVVIGGEMKDEVYGDFQEEMNILNTAFLEVMCEGDAKGRVFTFPIPTYNITKDFNWEDKGLDRLWEVTAKYGVPSFANFVNSDMNVDDARSMCCRLRLDNRELRKRGGGLFGASPLTGSIGVVTINMPRIGYLAKDEKEFMERLDSLMVLARNSLETKRKVLEHLTEGNLYPYIKFYLRDVYQHNKCYWKNHFSTIGLVGLNEACTNLLGKDIGTEEGRAFACRVLDFMRERLVKFQEETGNLFNLEATPAEGTSYRLARIDAQHFPDIKSASEDSSAPFYTNSSQLPVNYTDDIFRTLDLQDEIQTKYTGGTTQHIFLGESASDPEAVKNFVRVICDRYRLPYFTVTPTFSICPEHGYIRGRHESCPKCGGETEVYSRVVGYLRPVKQWNEGKQQEFKQRKTFHVDAR